MRQGGADGLSGPGENVAWMREQFGGNWIELSL